MLKFNIITIMLLLIISLSVYGMYSIAINTQNATSGSPADMLCILLLGIFIGTMVGLIIHIKDFIANHKRSNASSEEK